MAGTLTQIEFLLMLSEDIKAAGDDLSDEMRQRGLTHAQRVMELEAMLEKARRNLEGEKRRWRQYFPNPELSQEPPLPKVVMKGPVP